MPSRMRLYIFSTVEPMNGSLPESEAYRITPSDHTSTVGPTYFVPVTISGAAYLGEPQNVSRRRVLSYRLLRPKSMILGSLLSSRSMFSINSNNCTHDGLETTVTTGYRA